MYTGEDCRPHRDIVIEEKEDKQSDAEGEGYADPLSGQVPERDQPASAVGSLECTGDG